MKLLFAFVITLLFALISARDVSYTIYHTTDVHGWLLEKRHNPDENADFGDLLSLITHVNATALKERRNVLFFDTGDQLQGTGLSDATDPAGTVVMEATDKLPYDALTIGNHELGLPDSMDWMYKNYRHLHEGRMISSNVIYSNDKLFAKPYRVIKSPASGHNILSVGFMYDDRYPHKNTRVETVKKTVQSADFQKMLRENEHAAFIVLLCHFPHENPETEVIRKAIRNVFPDKALFFLTGHRHQLRWAQLDSNAYALESGCYYHSIGKLEFTFSEENGVVSNVQHKWIQANREKLIEEAGVPSRQFDTTDGLKLKKFLKKKFEDLHLADRLGCAKFTYKKRAPISDKDSIFKLWINDIFPSIEAESDNQQIFVMNTGSMRSNIYEGDVVVDDVMAIDPFDNQYVYFQDLTLYQIQALIGSLHYHGDFGVTENGDRLPNYYHTWYTGGYDGYDVITDDYTAVKLKDMLKKSNLQGNGILYHMMVSLLLLEVL
ncbi:hypothetical protein GEMRC1_012157 [Eukaryota sp. GEM-RC1]